MNTAAAQMRAANSIIGQRRITSIPIGTFVNMFLNTSSSWATFGFILGSGFILIPFLVSWLGLDCPAFL